MLVVGVVKSDDANKTHAVPLYPTPHGSPRRHQPHPTSHGSPRRHKAHPTPLYHTQSHGRNRSCAIVSRPARIGATHEASDSHARAASNLLARFQPLLFNRWRLAWHKPVCFVHSPRICAIYGSAGCVRRGGSIATSGGAPAADATRLPCVRRAPAAPVFSGRFRRVGMWVMWLDFEKSPRTPPEAESFRYGMAFSEQAFANAGHRQRRVGAGPVGSVQTSRHW